MLQAPVQGLEVRGSYSAIQPPWNLSQITGGALQSDARKKAASENAPGLQAVSLSFSVIRTGRYVLE